MDARRLSESFFRLTLLNKEKRMNKKSKKDVIAYRKTCEAKGTGLSHYILMDKKAK
jgi:modified peptide precursor CbpA